MNDIQPNPKPTGYLIPVGKTDDERLSALGAIYNPFSLKLLSSHITSDKPSILDVGCGNGELTILFAKTFPDADIVAIDNSQEQIDLAEKKAQNENVSKISWVRSDVFKLTDLQSKYPKLFDIVHSRFVLSHAPNPTDAIAPMLSMVKPGGLLIIEEVGAKKTFKEPLPKAIQAWKKLVEVQFKLQQSHYDTIERIVKHLETSGISYSTELFNTTIKGQQQKSLFRLGFEHGQKILAGLEQSGKIQLLGYNTAKELINSFGYDDAEAWQKDLLEFENDDNAKIDLEDIESIVAIKPEAAEMPSNTLVEESATKT